ncbi:MAG: flagellar hook-associated protein FlgL [Proteobacteria bacterium]|nr:flagellar hook-associated protein FlgL [Pseudomonadota bacterium]
MRISTTQYHSTMSSTLQTASSRLETVMQQMSTGQKLLLPSDDPITDVRLSRLNREEAAVKQYRDNIGALKVRLSQNEVSLDSMNSDMMSARDLMVWALDGGNSAEDVAAMTSSLKAIGDSLFYGANARDQEGRYLFSGTKTSTQPIVYDPTQPAGSRYSYQGNLGQQQVAVGNGVTQSANVTVEEMAAMLNQLEATGSALSAPGASANVPATRAQLTATLDTIDTTMGQFSSKIAHLGGMQNILETLDGNFANVSLSNQQALIDLGQLDYGDAVIKLNGYTQAAQATQKAYARVSQLSLFDVI